MKKQTISTIALILAGMFMGTSSAIARECTGTEACLGYISNALNHALQSYQNPQGVATDASKPRIVYVDQAYGQAIYSYPRVAPDIVTAFNVEHTDMAFGPAIYSYPSVSDRAGAVEILPLIAD